MALRSDLLDPIPGDNPAGEDLRYEPIYDEIKQARFEEDDLPQGEWERERKVADYPTVIRLAEETLAKETKDLQIAAWLTEALIHEEGFGGLLEGINLLKGLLETFWDSVYPEIDDDGDAEFRAMPLDWVGGYLELAVKSVPLNAKGHSFIDYELGRKIGKEEEVAGDSEKEAARAAAIQDGAVPPEDFESAFMATPKPFYKQLKADIDGCTAAITELDEFGTEKFGDVAPTYRTLRGAIDEVKRIAERLLEWKLELDPDPVEEAAYAASPDDGTALEAGAAPAGALTPEPTSRNDAAARLASVARYLRRERPTDPSPYLMVRGFRWGELMGNEGPPDPRLLDAPPTPIRTRLRGMLLDARWEDLIEACESVMATPQGRGWLDLQRYVLTALDALGGDYEAVAEAIKGALRTLLRDVPELPELVLMDDTPTANRETLGWLAEAGLLGAGAEPDELPVARPRREAGREVPAMVARAAARARSGDAQSAIQMLMDEISRTTSPRTRFLLQSEAARIMVESGLDAVARPLLQEMHTAIEEHRLEEWESGELVAQPLALLYQCVVRAEGEGAGQELYQRVCRLDPMLGIKVAGGAEEPEAEAAEAGVDGAV